MSDNLFFMVMEADGDELTPFDAGSSDAGDMAPEDIAPPATDNAGGGGDDLDSPPPLDDGAGTDDLGGFGTDDMGGGEETGTDESSNENEDEADQKDTKLSDKANNILNEQLYKRMVARNSEIEQILDQVQDLVPLLPIEVVNNNDESVNHLKSALMRGQKYAVNDFVESGYGENLLFFQKLDSLYTLLLNQINTNLKKIET